MALAAILGMCLLWPVSQAGIALPPRTMALWQSTPPQKNQADNSSAQSAPAQPSADQTKPSAVAPQTPAATPNCPLNSQSGSSAKPDCSKPKKHSRPHNAAAAPVPPPSGGPPTPQRTVVPDGGTTEHAVELSPKPSPQQASQLQSANQLLAASDANLKRISGHKLNAAQQDTVALIKSYMEQAKSAATDGDAQRAYNLAVKANLLSAELAGH